MELALTRPMVIDIDMGIDMVLDIDTASDTDMDMDMDMDMDVNMDVDIDMNTTYRKSLLNNFDFKGYEIFRLLFFSQNNSIWAPDSYCSISLIILTSRVTRFFVICFSRKTIPCGPLINHLRYF